MVSRRASGQRYPRLVGTPWGQQPYAVRLDWGQRGAHELVAAGVEVVVVVDVLSFTTSLTIAVDRGTRVHPCAWHPGSGAARDRAHEVDAVCALGRSAAGPGQISLSPASILAAPAPDRLVLPSPNGSAICEQLAPEGVTVVAACLRNAVAVGRWLARQPGPVGVVAAGERWAGDGSLRPAVEDLWGSGAVIDALLEKAPRATASPEAKVARTASRAVRHDLPEQLAACASGMELVEKGFPADVAIAAELDVSAVVPVLTNGWFSAVE